MLELAVELLMDFVTVWPLEFVLALEVGWVVGYLIVFDHVVVLGFETSAERAIELVESALKLVSNDAVALLLAISESPPLLLVRISVIYVHLPFDAYRQKVPWVLLWQQKLNRNGIVQHSIGESAIIRFTAFTDLTAAGEHVSGFVPCHTSSNIENTISY